MSAQGQSKIGVGYVQGPVHPNTKTYASIDTKPSTVYNDEGGTVTRDTGGGYERFRSYEYDPTKATRDKTDVYAAHHRLLAVAWCYPDEWSVSEILDDLHGKDVHHDAPECDGDRGVEWDNREDCLAVLDHGSHSEITQAQQRAFAEQRREEGLEPAGPDHCDNCGDETATLCASEDWQGSVCPECSQQLSDGGEIEVLQ